MGLPSLELENPQQIVALPLGTLELCFTLAIT
jgi:hypothetical protein